MNTANESNYPAQLAVDLINHFKIPGHIQKITIVMEAAKPPVVTVESFVPPESDESVQIKSMITEYELTPKQYKSADTKA